MITEYRLSVYLPCACEIRDRGELFIPEHWVGGIVRQNAHEREVEGPDNEGEEDGEREEGEGADVDDSPYCLLLANPEHATRIENIRQLTSS